MLHGQPLKIVFHFILTHVLSCLVLLNPISPSVGANEKQRSMDHTDAMLRLCFTFLLPFFCSFPLVSSDTHTHTHAAVPVNDFIMLLSAASEVSSWTKRCLTPIWPASWCTPPLSTVSHSVWHRSSSSFSL